MTDDHLATSGKTDFPLLSVVTVVLNDAQRISGTIASVQKQDYPAIEFIVIDGGSTDNTVTVINQHREAINTLISRKDKGIYDAMLLGAQQAHGQYIHFLNAGDYYLDAGVLTRMMRQMSPSTDILYGDYKVIYPDGRERTVLSHPPNELWRPFFNHQSAIYRTQLVQDLGFNLDFKPAADFLQLQQAVAKGAKICYISEIFVRYSLIGDSANQELRIIRLYAQIMKNFGWSPQMRLHYLWKICWIWLTAGIIKRVLPRQLYYKLQYAYRSIAPE